MGDIKILALSVLECGISVLDLIDPLQSEKYNKNVTISHVNRSSSTGLYGFKYGSCIVMHS